MADTLSRARSAGRERQSRCPSTGLRQAPAPRLGHAAGAAFPAPGFLRRLPRTAALLAAAVACSCTLLAAGTALAQTSPRPSLPPRAEPGQIERDLQRRAAPRLPGKIPALKGDFRIPPDQAGELSLVLTGVVIEGSTVYSDEDLASLYKDRLGRKIALAEVFKIADAITARYRNDGYILSRAILPPQTIADGVVKIRIVEGYIDNVRIEGEMRGGRTLLDAYAAKIKASRPLSNAKLERYLLLIDDLPGLSSKAVLRPAKDTPGAADLVILVEHDGIDAFARLDNRGTKFNGPGRLWLGAGLNSLTGDHDRTAARFVTARSRRELTYLELG
ncbi:MAG: ShlB/FhaC/HecB family hemolysin secretion/activation protein, partial [Rhodospirillaceae bacterium]|nr:ShlB/FhaC/HecB family hemolysin secretion/activation protein [Rhodospirillaceae bacterium]